MRETGRARLVASTEAYRAALQEYTPQRVPYDHAMVQPLLVGAEKRPAARWLSQAEGRHPARELCHTAMSELGMENAHGPSGGAKSDRPQVFISHARSDAEFVDQLAAGLDAAGFETQVNRSDIADEKDWQNWHGEAIVQADTVVVVLTPDAVAASTCGWDVGYASRAGKRLIPIMIKPLDGISVPTELSRHEYLHFYPEPSAPDSGFDAGLSKLVTALRIDIEWLRNATRYGELASRWSAEGEKGRPALVGRHHRARQGLGGKQAARRARAAGGRAALHRRQRGARRQGAASRGGANPAAGGHRVQHGTGQRGGG